MKHQIRLTAKAEEDVDRILAWFHEQRATEAGGKWLNMLLKEIDTLEERPERCPLVPESEELALEVRELLVGKRRGVYRVMFQTREKTVVILRIWHGARDAFTRDDLL